MSHAAPSAQKGAAPSGLGVGFIVGWVVISLLFLLNDAFLITPVGVHFFVVFLGLAPLTALALLVALVRALMKRGPWSDMPKVLAGAAIAVLALKAGWPVERIALAYAAERAGPLIAAIERYSDDHDAAPPSLDALVPHYLEEVPSTGLPAYPAFEYERFDDERQSFLWYDLGSRNGHEFSGLSIYPDGDPEHAILVFELSGRDTVTNARLDRTRDDLIPAPFDESLWWSDRSSRMPMARSLPPQLLSVSATRDDVVRTLGHPDGHRTLRSTPWELLIPCSRGFINWDVFVYWPTQDYPEAMHGGHVERIGGWAYVHE